MNRIPFFLVATLLVGFSLTAFAENPTGWKYIDWESPLDSFDDYEDIIVLEEDDREEGFFRGEKLIQRFELEEYKVAGIPFTAKFYFNDDDEFAAYTLTWTGDEDHAEDAYEEITRLLEEKYKRKADVGEEIRFGTDFLVRSELDAAVDDEREITITYLNPNEGEADRL